MKKYLLNRLLGSLFIFGFYAIPYETAAQGSVPNLVSPLDFQSHVTEGGNLVRCNPGNGACRTFQTLYIDADGDFPLTHNVNVWHHGSMVQTLTMTTTDLIPQGGLLYEASFLFPPAEDNCSTDLAISGWEYMFDFSDTMSPAEGENGNLYGIPYLKCESISSCVDSGLATTVEITYVQDQGTPANTRKFWRTADHGLTWASFTMVATGGSPASGVTYSVTIPADSTGLWDLKFDFNDGQSKAIGAGAIMDMTIRPPGNPFDIHVVDDSLAVPNLVNGTYRWWYEGRWLTGQIGHALRPATDGAYRVEVVDSNNCQYLCDPVYAVININGGVGIIIEIDIHDDHNPGAICPNPAGNNRIIYQTQEIVDMIELMDLHGVLRKRTLPYKSGIIEIHTEDIPNGLYYARIRSESGSTMKKVWVVN